MVDTYAAIQHKNPANLRQHRHITRFLHDFFTRLQNIYITLQYKDNVSIKCISDRRICCVCRRSERTSERSPKGFLNFVLDDLPWKDVDIKVNDTDVERRSFPKIPRIQNEEQRDFACYLNDSTWDRVREDVENLVEGLQLCPTGIYHGARAHRGSLKNGVPSVRQTYHTRKK